MTSARAYAAEKARAALAPLTIERRSQRENDVVIDILFCGVCHSDLHQVNDDWGGSIFPMVPGHEIVGRVTAVGGKVSKFKVGDLAGVGCFVDSCRSCPSCQEGLEQYCEKGATATYNSRERDTREPTYGGYSTSIVVDQKYTLRISPKLSLAGTAPLLCAGITTYSPLRHWKIGPGKKVGIVGLGGLGHMGIKLARAFGAHVVVFTSSAGKVEDALKLGAHEVVLSSDAAAMKTRRASLDFILNTVSAPHDINVYVNLLKRDGTMTLVGLPEKHPALNAMRLAGSRRSVAGSFIGGIAETQEMLDFCAEHGITADIELIPIQKINEAYRRLQAADVKYRFVIDMASLRNATPA